MSAAQVTALTALAEPVVRAHECALEGITIRRAGSRRLVRIVVDHDRDELSLDLVATISREISRVMDDSSPLGESPYVLEVSSPGVDRPLTHARHWRRAVGRLVRVVTAQGETRTGRLVDVEDATAVLEVDGVEVSVDRADIARANVEVEFTRHDEADAAEPGSAPEASGHAELAGAEEG